MRALALVFLGGCELVFGLSDPPPPEGDAPLSAQVTGTFHHRVARNGADNAIEVQNNPATDAVVQVRFENGEVETLAISDEGAFAFDRRSPSYAIFSSLDVGQELIETADTLTLINLEAGRSDAGPLTQPTQILLPASTSIQRELVTVGQWSNKEAPDPTFDWKATGGSGGLPLGVLEGTARDVIYLVEFTDQVHSAKQRAISSVNVIKEAKMTDGMPLDLRGLVVKPTVASNSCVTLQLRLAADRDAYLAAITSPSPPIGAFALLAAPSITTGFAGATDLAFPSPGNLVDVTADLEIKSFDPFTNHDQLAVIFVLTSRTVMLDDGGLFSLPFSFTRALPVPEGDACGSNLVAFESIAPAYAVDFKIGDTLLSDPDQDIVLARPENALVSWKADGKVDLYDVTLLEVIERQSALALDPRRTFRTRKTEVSIPESLLVPNHRYVIEVRTIIGFPDAKDGNYSTLTYPINNAATLSVPFKPR